MVQERKLNVRGITLENVQSMIELEAAELSRINHAIQVSPCEPKDLLEERDIIWFRLQHLYNFKKYKIWFGTVEPDGCLR